MQLFCNAAFLRQVMQFFFFFFFFFGGGGRYCTINCQDNQHRNGCCDKEDPMAITSTLSNKKYLDYKSGLKISAFEQKVDHLQVILCKQ